MENNFIFLQRKLTGIFQLGVAVSDNPTGHLKPQPEAIIAV